MPSRFPFLRDDLVVPVKIFGKLFTRQLLHNQRIRNILTITPKRAVGSPNKVHPVLSILV